MDSKSGGTSSSTTVNDGLTPQAVLERISKAKLEQRRKLATLPFEEKFRLVADMRRLSDEAVRDEKPSVLCDLTVRTYAVLHRSVQMLLPKEDEPALPAHWMTIGVLSAFLLEAYLNHAGRGLLSSWSSVERKLGPKEKLALISELLEIAIDRGREPFRCFDDVFRFRDLVAHGKTTTTTVPLPNNVTTHVLDALPLTVEPLRSSNRETIAPRAAAVDEMIGTLHAAYVSRARLRGLKEVDDPFELAVHGPVYVGLRK
jgi:hypothetical protein